jgi:cytochrome c-type biogenesis protein CcsB
MALEWKTGPGMTWLYASLAAYALGFLVLVGADLAGGLMRIFARRDEGEAGRRGAEPGAAYTKPLRWSGYLLYACAALLSFAAWILRWGYLDHAPLRSMFDVFLTMGAALGLVTLASVHLLKVRYVAWDMFLGVLILFPAAFVPRFDPSREPMMPALQSSLFIPHVLTYMVSYVIMFKAAIAAVALLLARPVVWLIDQFTSETVGLRASPGRVMGKAELDIYRLICFGFPLMTAGLLLGSIWGKLAWTGFWQWDPKEIWGLITWLVYVMYFHWRYMHGRKWPLANAAFAILGLAAILMTLLGVSYLDVFKGVHSYAN